MLLKTNSFRTFSVSICTPKLTFLKLTTTGQLPLERLRILLKEMLHNRIQATWLDSAATSALQHRRMEVAAACRTHRGKVEMATV